jgi:hypothetical protein
MHISKEQKLLTRYITGRMPVNLVAELLQNAQLPPLPAKDQRAWNMALRFPWLLSCIDGAYAWRKPHSAFRKRMLIYFSIMESIPEYSDLFLPRNRSAFYWLVIGFRSCWAGLKGLFGCFLLLFI